MNLNNGGEGIDPRQKVIFFSSPWEIAHRRTNQQRKTKTKRSVIRAYKWNNQGLQHAGGRKREGSCREKITSGVSEGTKEKSGSDGKMEKGMNKVPSRK